MDLQNSDCDWTFDAPQFFDFKKVLHGLDESFNSESYFDDKNENPTINLFTETAVKCTEVEAEIDDYDESTSEEMQEMHAMEYYNLNLSKKNLDLLSGQGKIEESVIDNNPVHILTEKSVVESTAMNPLNSKNNINETKNNVEGLKIVQENQIDCIKPIDLLANLPEFSNDKTPIKQDKGRIVLKVNSARKRLSMSVDRGNKFKSMCSKQDVPMITNFINHLPSHNSRKHLRFALDKENQPPIDEENDVNIVNSLDMTNFMANNGILTSKHQENQHVVKKEALTTFKPFSFEDRNKQLIDKKEQFIRKMLEEEKKQRKAFRAQPFPELIFTEAYSNQQQALHPIHVIPHNPVTKKGRISAPSSLAGSHNSLRSSSTNLKPTNSKTNSHESIAIPAFKAKKATILAKAPFIPQKSARTIIDVLPSFKLKTQERAEHRAEADKAKKQKEEEMAQLLKERENYKLIEEQKSKKYERAITVHKAQPIRHYKPVEPTNSRTTPTLCRARSFTESKN